MFGPRAPAPEVVARDARLAALATLPWHTLPTAEAFKRLASRESGLTPSEVESSRESYGRNVTTNASKPGLAARIWGQVNNVLIWILIISAGISGGFQDYADMGLILAVVILNVMIGVIQEGKAEAAADALNDMLAAKATVVRGGEQTSIPAEDVVVGDIIVLNAGDAIAADVRLFSSSSMKVKESALTGESEDVEKMTAAIPNPDASVGDMKNCAFAGTVVSAGSGLGVVTAIGAHAVIGSIKTLVDEADAGETPLQAQLEVFGRYLSGLTVVVAIGTFFLAWIARRIPLSSSFAISISIAVAIIPEGLPSVVTITLAIGVRRMAEHNAIIRQLPAVETLGSVSVVCSDKTGTLTLNEMMVTRVRTAEQQFIVEGQGYDPTSGEVQGSIGSLRKHDRATLEKLYWLLLPGVIANDGGLAAPKELAKARAASRMHTDSQRASTPSTLKAAGATVAPVTAETEDASADPKDSRWQIAGDPTDVAVLVLGHKVGIEGNINAFKARFETIDKIPFDSDYKFQSLLTDVETPTGEKRVLYLKGAWDEIIRRCSHQAVGGDAFTSAPCNTAFWLAEASSYAANGMRVLAIAQWEAPPDCMTVPLERVRDEAVTTPFLQLNALIAIVDPCRSSAAKAIADCHTAGVQVKMITGDHADTACYIARELGIISPAAFDKYLSVKDSDPEARRRIVLRGDEIKGIPSDAKESHLAKYVMDVNVFARVAPEHKLRIVRALKETHGCITSMTGDGVNDAPALKEAHVGVAMGITGTDVAKQAAKMILADDQFSTIAEAVRRGRGVYDNLQKVVLFALPTNTAQGAAVVIAMAIGMPVPLDALQVLTVNMVTSVTLGIVIALEEPEGDVMARPPRDPSAPLLDAMLLWRCTYITIILCASMLGNMAWELSIGGHEEVGRAIAMSTLVIAQCFFAFSCRFVSHTSITPAVFRGNPWLLGAVLLNAIIQVFLVHTPIVNKTWSMEAMNASQWGRVILFAVIVFLIVEADKVFTPILAPRMAPCLRAVAAAWHTITCGCACCRSRACGIICPTGSGGLPMSHSARAPEPPAPVVPPPAPSTGASGGEALAIPVGPAPPSAAETERMEREMRIAKKVRSSRHIKAPPVASEVQSFVSTSRANLDLPVGIMSADGEVHPLQSGRSSRAGTGGGGALSHTSSFTNGGGTARTRAHAAQAQPLAVVEEIEEDARGIATPAVSPGTDVHFTPHMLASSGDAAAGDPTAKND